MEPLTGLGTVTTHLAVACTFGGFVGIERATSEMDPGRVHRVTGHGWPDIFILVDFVCVDHFKRAAFLLELFVPLKTVKVPSRHFGIRIILVLHHAVVLVLRSKFLLLPGDPLGFTNLTFFFFFLLFAILLLKLGHSVAIHLLSEQVDCLDHTLQFEVNWALKVRHFLV